MAAQYLVLDKSVINRVLTNEEYAIFALLAQKVTKVEGPKSYKVTEK